MDELIAELRKLGATVEQTDYGITVNGCRIGMIDVKRKDDVPRFTVGMKVNASVRTAAYYILTERIPELKRLDEVRAFIEQRRVGLPGGVKVFVMPDGEVKIITQDVEQLKQVFAHMSKEVRDEEDELRPVDGP